MRDMMTLDGEFLNHSGAGGGIHFCWQDAKGIATPRHVTDEHVHQWFETTEDGQHFKAKGYRLVHLHTYAGPFIVPNVQRLDDYTLTLDGDEYTVSGSSMPNGEMNYHDLHVHAEHNGRTITVENYSIKHSLLEYLNHEQALESQR